MRVFVTGATGFVGGNLVQVLLSQGLDVVALSRTGEAPPHLAGLPVTWVRGDLADAGCSLEMMMRACAWVFHVAALYSTDPALAPLMYAVNVGGTKRVLVAAERAGVERVVHTSTVGTLGRREDGLPPNEEVPFNLWERASHYARSKYLGEVAALEWAGRGLPVVVVNPCAPVGPGDHKPTSTGRRILDYLQGRMPSYLDGGINFVHVRDVAWGHLLAARFGEPGRRYILGHLDGNLRREDFLRLMARASGQPAPRTPGPRWHTRLAGLWRSSTLSQPTHRPEALTADPHRAVCELGLPQTDLQEAFAEAVAWFRETGMAPEHKHGPFGPQTRPVPLPRMRRG
ncbi:MAG: NAD-dependent epimerase/dehydratase family protein [Anaerolineae bacterium]